MNTPLRHVARLLCVAAIAMANACTDDTSSIGLDAMPSADTGSSTDTTIHVVSKSFRVDSILANTSSCYLGSVVDPETRARTTSHFLAQFHCQEDYQLPDISRMIVDDKGNPICDSAYLRIYIDSYYGDSLTTMKLRVRELDTLNIMEEGRLYYSNFDVSEFIPDNPRIDREITYTVKDLTQPDSVTESSTYYWSVRIKLPTDYGQRILQKYYDDATNYANSYNFIHNVCPGFYFECIGGIGSMLNVAISTLDVYFRYSSIAVEDSIIDGMQRMAATEEVLQNNVIENTIPDEMLATNGAYSYLKTPTGIFTEVTLPVAEIVNNHYTDTISQARIAFRRYVNTSDSEYTLSPPSNVAMLRKDSLNTFFENGDLTNSITSYLGSFSTSSNAYIFSNIGNLVSYLKAERDEGAGVTYADTDEQRRAKWAAWEAEEKNGNWNKVVLVPVSVNYTYTSTSYYTYSTLTAIHNLFALSSVKIEGGTSDESELPVNVVYSSFNE